MAAARFVPLLLSLLLLAACGGDRPFSSAEWKALREAGKTGSRMAGMAEALVREGTALGMNPSEVLDLLGEDESDGGQRGRAGELEWVVDEAPWVFQCTVLRINFGPDRRVSEVFTEVIHY